MQIIDLSLSALPHIIGKDNLVMPSNTQKPPQQPKIRSSCDGCGAVKLKCDRQHPECGRCVAHGIPCVYGVSRKIGKPPRKRINSGDDGSVGARPGTDADLFSTVSDSHMSYTWDMMDSSNNDGNDSSSDSNRKGRNSNNNSSNSNSASTASSSHSGTAFNFDAFINDSYGGLPGSSALSTSTPLDFGEWTLSDHFDGSAPPSILQHFASINVAGKPSLHGDPATGPPAWPHPALSDESSPTAIKEHDCHREAHELLGSSLFANPGAWDGSSHFAGSPTLADSSLGGIGIGIGIDVDAGVGGAGGAGEQVALDHLLLLNRRACEQLGTLLACSCAGSPYLMMLYASLIAAILTRYHHAADDPLCASWSPLNNGSAPPSQGSAASTAPDGGGGGDNRPSRQSVGPAVAPARIAVGAFSVDDHRVQSALKIQLLAGEVRRVGHLIDQFTSHQSDGQYHGEQSSGSSVDELHQSLGLWLRGEHVRISNMIGTRLRKLNTT